MKQIERVSIGGYAFSLEEEATDAVVAYLKDMAEHYPNHEIVEGIEERMAELLLEKTPRNGVVSLESIEAIMDILGRPEKIEAEEPDNAAAEEKSRKKLYRDLENARVGGVCSGLAEYLNFDAAALRIIFVVLSLAGLLGWFNFHAFPFRYVSVTVPMIYAILWVCMPAARTARQRWEQKGEDGTAESIRRTIENGAAEVSDALHQVGKSPAWGRLGRVMEIVIGMILLVIAVTGLFAGALGLFGGEWLGFKEAVDTAIDDISYPQLKSIIDTSWVRILAIAVYTLPFLGMLYGSIMMIFHFRSPSWHPGLVIFVLWLIALVGLAVLCFAGVFSADIQGASISI